MAVSQKSESGTPYANAIGWQIVLGGIMENISYKQKSSLGADHLASTISKQLNMGYPSSTHTALEKLLIVIYDMFDLTLAVKDRLEILEKSIEPKPGIPKNIPVYKTINTDTSQTDEHVLRNIPENTPQSAEKSSPDFTQSNAEWLIKNTVQNIPNSAIINANTPQGAENLLNNLSKIRQNLARSFEDMKPIINTLINIHPDSVIPHAIGNDLITIILSSKTLCDQLEQLLKENEKHPTEENITEITP